MPIVRRTRAEIDEAELLAKLATRPRPGEDEIETQAAEDGDVWTDEELAEAEPVYPPPSPERLRALRARLGLTQAQFARRFGFTSTRCGNTSKGVGGLQGRRRRCFGSSTPILTRCSAPSGCPRRAKPSSPSPGRLLLDARHPS